MASAISPLIAVFLCLALVVVHVHSARLLLQAGNDTVGMTAQTTATTEDFAAQGTPPAAGEPAEFQVAPALDTTTTDAIVYNNDALAADPTTPEFATLSFDRTKRALTRDSTDAGTLVPLTEASFAQKDSVRPDTFYNLNDDFPADQGTLVGDSPWTSGPDAGDSFASKDRGFLAGDHQGAAGSGSYDYSYDATKRDAAYPADINAGDSEFALADFNPRFGSESGNPSTPEGLEFEFAELDITP